MKIIDNFITINEQQKLLEFFNNYKYKLQGVGENTPYCHNRFGFSANFPELRNRIIEEFKLQDYKEDTCRFGDKIFVVTPGGKLHTHIDNYIKFKHVRVNIMLQKPEIGGNPVLDKEYEISERSCWCFQPDIVPHSTTLVEGNIDRITISFGFIK